MNKSIIISVFCIFLFCINSVAEETKTTEDSEKTPLIWDPLFSKVHKRISGLENTLNTEREQQHEFNSKISDELIDFTKIVNDRIGKVEETSSILETNDIAESFKGTIDVLNTKTSEMERKFENIEISIATLEKIYHVSQEPLETLMKVIDKQAAVIYKISKKLENQEEILLAMRKGSEDTVTDIESDNKPGTVATGLKERTVTLHETESGTEESGTDKPDTEKSSKPEECVFMKNVRLYSTDTSTKISGEIVNRSDMDHTVASFIIQLFDKKDNLLKTLDIITTNLNVGSTNKIDELIVGVDLENIARYIVLFNDTELTVYEEEEPETEEKQSHALTAEEKTEKAVEAAQVEVTEEKTEETEEAAQAKEELKAIGNDFYVRNVIFTEFGSSTLMSGEINNDSRENITGALFSLKVLGENNDIIFETEFSILSINSNETTPFDQMITGIHPSQITEYEITFKNQ